MTPSKVYTYDTANSDYGGGIPTTAQSVAPYIDRRFANRAAAEHRFPHLFATGMVQQITCGELFTDVLDWEPGNRCPDAGMWIAGAKAAGVWRPMPYADCSDLRDHVLPQIEAHFGPINPDPARREFRIWSAHPGQGEHICGPDTCNEIPVKANMTQHWWGSIDGHGSVDMDISVSLPEAWHVFDAPPPPKPSMHYERFDTRARKDGPKLTEAQVVRAYDKYRAQQTHTHHPHRAELKVLRAAAKWYADRVAELMMANAPKGKRLDTTSQRAKGEHWGWRYQQLIHRYQGKLLKPTV